MNSTIPHDRSHILSTRRFPGHRLPRPKPCAKSDLLDYEVSVRAPNEKEELIKILYPTTVVIAEQRPRLRWAAAKTAEAYRIEIADEGFHQVAKSEDLPATMLAWTPTSPLKRGVVYTWTIRAVKQNGEPSSVTSQGKFKVLSNDRNSTLNRLKSVSRSHLALGLFYAREGMMAQAESEFAILVKGNPDSAIAKRLLTEVRSWRKR